MYCGKPVEMTNDSLGKQVVKSLLVKVPEVPKKHTVYFNKLFHNTTPVGQSWLTVSFPANHTKHT